jgi:hypothetical protein
MDDDSHNIAYHANRIFQLSTGTRIWRGRFCGVIEGTPGDSEYESQFLNDGDSQLLPRGELGCGAQADDEDADFATPVPPPRAPPRLVAAATPIAAPLLSTATVGATAGASRKSSSLEYMSMQVGKATTDSLKFYLRRLNIIGITN